MRGTCSSKSNILLPGFGLAGEFSVGANMWHDRQEGVHAFYKGITPRIMRVAPGQAVTFTVYEYVKDKIEKSPWTSSGDKYQE